MTIINKTTCDVCLHDIDTSKEYYEVANTKEVVIKNVNTTFSKAITPIKILTSTKEMKHYHTKCYKNLFK